MSAVAAMKREGAMVTAEHADAIRVALKSSLYPGASDASVDLVLSYCRAAGLDPMQKPVHIVPMWDGKAREMRDVVMPGIGLYRTNAARTGQFAGMSEPEFGPMVTQQLGNREVTFPEWCKVTAYRQLPSGHVAEFTAVEYWIENYAIKGGKEQDQAPNSMWSKRVRGQIAKCAQAQALRMAFPEAVGAGPTAEEMEGKAIIDGESVAVERREPARPVLQRLSDEDFAAKFPAWEELIRTGKKTADQVIANVRTKAVLSDAQIGRIQAVKAVAEEVKSDPSGEQA